MLAIAPLLIVLILLVFATKAHVYVNDDILDYDLYPTAPAFWSVAYFKFTEREWEGIDVCLDGYVYPMDHPFVNNTSVDSMDPDERMPNMLFVGLEERSGSSIANITRAATTMNVEYIILFLNSSSWKARLSLWWTNELPGYPSKYLISESEASSCRFLAVPFATGIKLQNWMREKKMRQKNEFTGLIVGIDDISPTKGQDCVAKAVFYLAIIALIAKWLHSSEQPPGSRHQSFLSSQQTVPIEGTELALGVIQEGASHECAVCLDTCQVGAVIRILPCRHSFHHECIVGWLGQSKYTCPLCKFDLRPHIEEQRAAHEDTAETTLRVSRGRWLFGTGRISVWRWRRIGSNDDHLLDPHGDGDLELTLETGGANSTSGELA